MGEVSVFKFGQKLDVQSLFALHEIALELHELESLLVSSLLFLT